MEKVKLINLIGQDVEGITANVMRQGGKYHYDYQDEPLIRKMKRVYFRKEDGKKWLYWTWEPARHKDGYYDCGYSGIMDCKEHRADEAYIYIERRVNHGR